MLKSDKTAEKLTVKATSTNTSTVSDTFEVNVFAGAVIDIDYEDMTAEISSTNYEDCFVFLEVSKKSGDTPGKGTIYCYEMGKGRSVNVDLSFLKLSKDVYGAQNTTPFEQVKIAAQPRKPSIKFKDGVLNVDKLDNYEYRTQNTEWIDGDYLGNESNRMKITGTTLFMRLVGDNEKGTLPSTEVKVKIPANQKAPKVTIDYAISDEESYLADLRDGCSILVRTNDTKKGASQPAFVEIKSAPVIAVKAVSGSAIDTVAIVTGVNEKGETQYGDSLKFEYGEKELTFTPSSTSTFAYSLDGAKFSKIKSGTKVKIDKIDKSKGVIN